MEKERRFTDYASAGDGFIAATEKLKKATGFLIVGTLAGAVKEAVMGVFCRKPKHLSPEKQKKLDTRLFDAAYFGHTEVVKLLLASGANVHAKYDFALRWAAWFGHTETVKVLLASGADVHAGNDAALRWAADHGHTETVRVLAKHIFAPDSWRGKTREEIEAQAAALYNKIEADNPQPDNLRKAGDILTTSAIEIMNMEGDAAITHQTTQPAPNAPKSRAPGPA
jgi:hypothetical protein